MFRTLASLAVALFILAACGAHSTVDAAPDAPPACSDATASLTADYRYVVGSADFSDANHDAESGSTFRWLVDSSTVASGQVAEELLLNFDGSASGANGENAAAASGVSYTAGHFGQALALAESGSLYYARADTLPLSEGTWELWLAPRADGNDPVYADPDRWQVLLYYEAPDGDNLFIVQDNDSGVLYAGGTVNGEWESAYSSAATTRGWRAGQWHHVAFTFSATGNFMRFYVDGALVADTNEGHYWPPSTSGGRFAVGGTLWATAAHYWLDEVRLSGRVADANEIAARAQRTNAAGPNEVWLPTKDLAGGSALAYEFTPRANGENGASCTSPTLPYPGIPITNPQPPSTLLPPGSTSVHLAVTTSEATACAWAVGQRVSYEQMSPFDPAPVTPQQIHTTTVTGLNPDPAAVNDVYVRCAAHPDYLLHLQYRSLSVANPRFPRTGNLWGAWNFLDKGLDAMKRIDLWLGADALSSDQMRDLRGLNPDALILTSVNAVENNDLSEPRCNGCQGAACDAWFLKDVNGNKIEVWPGSYRINLTLPQLAEYQACYAYMTVLDKGLMPDGVFFDNVMTTQSWLTHDIYGTPIQIDANGDGIADDPDALDAAWKAGVFHEIRTFRGLIPYAIVSNHSTDIYEPEVADLFNGISIGFATANVIEGEDTFADVFTRYRDWLRLAVPPRVTMVESSPIDQIAYGYDYDPLSKIPPSTLEFARTYYPWMRFGLALTLMDDGYFAHEFGDTWHGNDWWYDELDFDLGYPLAAASRVPVAGFDPGLNQIENPGFEQLIGQPWHLWADTGSGCAATLTRDTAAAAPEGSAAARVDVTASCGDNWRIELAQYNRSLVQGTNYDVTFWARSNVTRVVEVSSQKGSPDWDGYGLSQTVDIGPTWKEYTVTFEANTTASDARIQLFLGDASGTIWLDNVRLTLHPPDVYRRDYENGIVLLNGTRSEQTITLGPGFRRLTGQQAPRYETILDDADQAFSVISGNWTQASYDSGEWQASGPFYHNWGSGLRELSGAAGQAKWSLPIRAADTYTLTAWWPAAPAASAWNAAATFEIVAAGQVIASATFDQRSGGDQWHQIGTVVLAPADAAYVRLTCAGAPCVADALHLSSLARYNDGSPAESVTLAPMDGVILGRAPAVEPQIYLPVISGRQAQLNWTVSGVNCRYDVYRGATPYFAAGADTVIAGNLPAGTTTFTDSASHVGNTEVEDYYLVRATGCDGHTTADSGRVGFVDFALVPGQ
jgi:hypothetical protein